MSFQSSVSLRQGFTTKTATKPEAKSYQNTLSFIWVGDLEEVGVVLLNAPLLFLYFSFHNGGKNECRKETGTECSFHIPYTTIRHNTRQRVLGLRPLCLGCMQLVYDTDCDTWRQGFLCPSLPYIQSALFPLCYIIVFIYHLVSTFFSLNINGREVFTQGEDAVGEVCEDNSGMSKQMKSRVNCFLSDMWSFGIHYSAFVFHYLLVLSWWLKETDSGVQLQFPTSVRWLGDIE